jgi:hypothetical protein
MFAVFGILVHAPTIFIDPHTDFNWAANAINLALIEFLGWSWQDIRLADGRYRYKNRRSSDIKAGVTNHALYGASNEPGRRRDVECSLTRGKCGAVSLAELRGSDTLEVSAERVFLAKLDRSGDLHHDLPGETFQMLAGGNSAAR